MQYGHFDDARREYVITNPRTPFPWINYLGTEDFFGLISNTAGGYDFCKDAKFRRLTRYRYNGVPTDNGGRYFYINDDGCVWNPGWKPCRTPLDSYECRHGLNYTTIRGSKNGLEATVTFFVPLGAWAEVQRMTLCNRSREVKRILLFSLAEWCLWNAQTDMENFQRNLSTGEVEVDGNVLYHKTEYRERRNHYAYYAVSEPPSGFDTDRDAFLGPYNGFDAPQSVMEGLPRCSEAHGWSPIASHCLYIVLQPGEKHELAFMLGYEENDPDDKWEAPQIINKRKALEAIDRYCTPEKADRALAELKAYWDNLLSTCVLRSEDRRLDRMVNLWNPYQCMITFCFSRSASFFESGIGRGMGFRDSNQDLVGFLHLIPERARQRILDIAATQFPDGGCYHQYQPLTKKGNNEIGQGFNDDPMWLIFGTVHYVKETGDFGILQEKVPFDNRPGTEVPLLQHLRASFDHVVNNLGPHGLPLIGRADWNDCLNLNCFSDNPDESFQTTENRTEGSQAESLMIAGLFVMYGREYARLVAHLGMDDEAARATAHVNRMVEAVKQHGWDGEWFLRAYDYFGRKVGSHENDEGKIFIESNGWCGMAGIGLENGMLNHALDSVYAHLSTEHGIMLQQPAYTTYHIELGEISSYPEGYKENAGIFCHNNPWVIIAETVRGRGDIAWDYYRRICPAYVAEGDHDLHKLEPYVYAQMIAGRDAFRPGEAKNSWLTGTAAWNYFAVTQYILGIRPEYDGLFIDPCIPSGWERYTVERKFRGATYRIKVHNPAGRMRGVTSIKVDGVEIQGNLLPLAPAGHTCEVEVTL